MIRFIDANTGNVYNGNMPYIHWFDGKQSIGLNYDKRFNRPISHTCTRSTKNSSVVTCMLRN